MTTRKHKLPVRRRGGGTVRSLQVGDRVRLNHYRTALSWGDRKPQEYGFIVSIDGAYIRIRPRWWKKDELLELYPNEITLGCFPQKSRQPQIKGIGNRSAAHR